MTDIRTARLLLRPFVRSDAPAIAAMIGDPRVATMLADIALPFDVSAAERWLKPAMGDIQLAIERGGGLIGGVSYHIYPRTTGVVGYWLGHVHWGHGYAREAAEAVIEKGFAQDRLKDFWSSHFIDNPASGRILTRLGFTPQSNMAIWCPARQSNVEAIGYTLVREAAGHAPIKRHFADWLEVPSWRRWTGA